MKKPVYLDYAATTPVDPRVAKAMIECLEIDGNFGNPASRSHQYGWMAESAVELARKQVADLVGASPREIVWTSGATESDNLAIKGAAYANSDRGKHIITSQIEHKAVLDSCAFLAKLGWEVSYLAPDARGLISVDQVRNAMRDDTVLVTIMHVNNEIGTVNPVAEIGALCRENGVLFHVDAAQSAGKEPIDVTEMNIDMLSLSAHKIYGPKGIGALFVRKSPDVSIEPIIHGGGHERGMRSGTLPTHQLVGFGQAAKIALEERESDMAHAKMLREIFLSKIEGIEGIHVNGSLEARVPFNLNLGFDGVDGETLLIALKDVAVSSGSACNSASVAPSFVLVALGVPDKRALTSLRFSFGRFATKEEVEFAATRLTEVLARLRA